MPTPTQTMVRAARRRGATVLTHRQWGSRELRTYASRRIATRRGVWPGFKLKADTLVLHITVTFDSGELRGDFKADMQTVERIGKERSGSGISYNACVDMATGMAGVGQPLDSKGTHTVNDKAVPGYSRDQNLVARAIACLGMPGALLSDAALETIVDLMVGMWEAGALTDDPDVVPHSLFAYKDCPTTAVRDRIPEIRRRYRARIQRATTTTTTRKAHQ